MESNIRLHNKLEDIIKKYVPKPLIVAGMIGMAFNIDKGYSQEIKWRREYATVVNGQYLRNAYAGGIRGHTPSFCDIDGDGDQDMFTGLYGHGIYFYLNEGNPTMPNWTFVTQYYFYGYDYDASCAFCDIDADGDYDVLIGHEDGYAFFRNDGNSTSPSWTLDESTFNLGWLGQVIRPAFVDIDDDGDYDLFMGGYYGQFYFFRNDGTPTCPSWTLISNSYNGVSATNLAPAFCDIDNDGDYDLFIGQRLPCKISFYKNNGNATVPSWTLASERYISLELEGENSSAAPAFVDIDDDGDPDMFVGQHSYGDPWGYNLNFWRNMGFEKKLKADLNNDGIVNFYDLAKFAEQWLMTEDWYDRE